MNRLRLIVSIGTLVLLLGFGVFRTDHKIFEGTDGEISEYNKGATKNDVGDVRFVLYEEGQYIHCEKIETVGDIEYDTIYTVDQQDNMETSGDIYYVLIDNSDKRSRLIPTNDKIYYDYAYDFEIERYRKRKTWKINN